MAAALATRKTTALVPVFLVLLAGICIDAIPSHCFFLPNIALSGGTYDEFPATEITSCCVACAKNPCCVGYSWSQAEKKCYMKSAIGKSEENKDVVSGIKANHNANTVAFLRNVRIEGSRSNVVALENAEACQQYCTAYGIYSWSPPSMQKTAIEPTADGECSCITRITALYYNYGSQSVIFPVGPSVSKK